MKTLLLLRHAKSSWDDDRLPDHDRPLAPRGRRAAPAMARLLQRRELTPDRVLCSTAARTRESWALVQEELGLEATPVVYIEGLYLADPGRMLRTIREEGRDAGTLLLVGHNPGIQELALALTELDRGGSVERMERKYPTAALAVIEFERDSWDEIAPGRGRLRKFVRPKDLPEAASERL